MHVEGADDALCDLTTRALYQVLGQAIGQVGLARAAGAGEDEAPVLEQEADVVLHHRLGDERLEHQAVHAFLLQTCTIPKHESCWAPKKPHRDPIKVPAKNTRSHWLDVLW